MLGGQIIMFGILRVTSECRTAAGAFWQVMRFEH